jgi:hypothetical protein
MVLRTIGILLILAALIAAGFEIHNWRATGTYKPIPAGEVWFKAHPKSLTAFQPAVQRHVAPWLWPPIQWVLEQPAWAVAGVPGIVFFLISLRRRNKRRRGAVRFPHDD